ncbi:MAG: HAD family hydrolase [Burkholderiales bacterium]
MSGPRESIKAITLDLDDTLWPSGPAIAAAEDKLHRWLEANAPAVAAALPPPQFALFRRALASELPHISHDFTALRLEAIKRALTLYGEDVSLAGAAMNVFLVARSEVNLYADVQEALERLAKRYRLVALTNGNADIGRAGVGEFFVDAITAGSAGVAKPDARIFQMACGTLGLEPSAVLHAGDHPDLDVRAAVQAGLRAAWINRSQAAWVGDAASFHEFHDLAGLCDWLDA